MDRIFAVITRWILVVGLFVLTGCVKSPSVDSQPHAAHTAVRTTRTNEVQETWDVHLLKDARIGYGHTLVRHETEAGQKIVTSDNESHLAMKRGDQTTKLDIHTKTIETPEGQLIRFENEMCMGPSPRRTIGRVRGNRLDLETTSTGAAPMLDSIPWLPDYRGPLAVDQTLLSKPMHPGEHRTLKVLLIEFNQVAEVEMVAKTFEPTALLNGTYDLLRIETIMRLANGQKIEATVWTNRTGATLKSYSQAMGLETYRASKAEALDKADVAELDLFPNTMVKVAKPLPNAHQTKQIRYRVHLEGSDPAGVFLTGPSQVVKSIDQNTAEITVYAIRPDQADGNRNALADLPTDDDLRPNSFIQSDDPAIMTAAEKIAGRLTDPWQVAVALERYVNREVTKKNFSQAFATAAEVAKSREGDCTEHAVFLAALCRAGGIPARVTVGLVYMEGINAFGYHMWTEAYVGKRWIPLDGTLAQGGIGAGHLAIAHTNLKGATAYSAFLPVVQILGRLGIEIVDVK
jgi:hypothetical protein